MGKRIAGFNQKNHLYYGKKFSSITSKAQTKPIHKFGVPKGIRTPVPTVKGWCPRPLDDGDFHNPCHIVN